MTPPARCAAAVTPLARRARTLEPLATIGPHHLACVVSSNAQLVRDRLVAETVGV